MKSRQTAPAKILALVIGFSGGISPVSAQQSTSGTVPESTVVTVEARHGKDIPVISREDVRVFEGHTRLQETNWITLKGDPAPLMLSVLSAESYNTNLAAPFPDI